MELGRGRASLSADTGAGDGKEASSASSTGGPPSQESISQVSKARHSQTPSPGLLLRIQLPETLLSLFLPCNNPQQVGRKGLRVA